MFNVISIKQAYAGHAKQAALLAASCQSGSYLGRFVVVVDDDVDPTEHRRSALGDVHALRSAPRTSTSSAAPGAGRSIRACRRARRGTRARSIDACRPFEMLGDFPPVVKASAELRARVLKKFDDQLK